MRVLTIVCVVVLGGCASQMPTAKNFEDSKEEVITSPVHWQKIAAEAARSINACGCVHTRIADADSSKFSNGFHEFLLNAIAARKQEQEIALTSADYADCVVSVHVEVIRHNRNVYGPADATLLGTGLGGIVWLIAAQPLSVPSWAAWLIGGGAGATYDVARANIPGPTGTEVVVAVELYSGQQLQTSFARAYYVDNADIDEYLPTGGNYVPRAVDYIPIEPSVAQGLPFHPAIQLTLEGCNECKAQTATPAPPKIKKKGVPQKPPAPPAPAPKAPADAGHAPASPPANPSGSSAPNGGASPRAVQ